MKNNVNNLFCYTAAVGFILDQAHKMVKSKFYFHKVKKYGNQFLKEIAKHEDEFTEFINADVMSESYQVFENLLNISLKINQKKKKAFERELNELIKKYSQND